MDKTLRQFSIAAALFLFCAAPSFSLGNREATAFYKQGQAAQRAGRMDEALRLYNQAAQADPDFLQSLFAIGRLHQDVFEKEMHGYAEAVDAYEKLAVKLLQKDLKSIDREVLPVYYNQGLLFLKGGDYEKAAQSLEKFIELDPDFKRITEVHNALGIAYYYLDQYEKAVGCFKRALLADSANNEARFNLRSVFTRVTAYSEAVVLRRSGSPGKALKTLESLRDIAPRYIPARRLEANLLQEMNRHEEAVRVFEEILGFEPDNPGTYLMRIDLARSLLALKRPVEARSVLLDNLARFPNVEDQRARMEVINMLSQMGGPQ